MRIASNKSNEAASTRLKERLTRTPADPERFYLILEQWSERFAILMLPISALLFIFQRRFYLYNIAISSLHSLSALGLVIILAMAASTIGDGWSSLILLPAPIHLFVHMRGVDERHGNAGADGSSILSLRCRRRDLDRGPYRCWP